MQLYDLTPCTHTTITNTYTNSGHWDKLLSLKAGSRGLQRTSVNAHMNVFTPLSHLTTFLSPLYLSPHHAPTCLAHGAPSFHLLILSTPPSIHYGCAANCSAAPLARRRLLSSTRPSKLCRLDLTALELPERKDNRQTVGQKWKNV